MTAMMTNNSVIRTDKGQLRQKLKSLLAQFSSNERIEKSRAICNLVLESGPFRNASTVMLFLSLPSEVDTTELFLSAWQQGKTVVVPRMLWEQQDMIPVKITSLETGIEKGRMGLRNPVADVAAPLKEIDFVVTPGLGFDRQGNRLGRGAAYYDRFFSTPNVRAVKWGVGFSEQLCPQIPHDEQDVPVDAVVTEQGIIRCLPMGQA